MWLILFISDRIVSIHKSYVEEEQSPVVKNDRAFLFDEKKEDIMKLIAVVLIVRFFLEMISNKNDERDNNNDVSVQENVLHPAEHQLRWYYSAEEGNKRTPWDATGRFSKTVLHEIDSSIPIGWILRLERRGYRFESCLLYKIGSLV